MARHQKQSNDKGAALLRTLAQPYRRHARRAMFSSVLSRLLWLPQAGALAVFLGGLLAEGHDTALWPIAAFAALGVARALLDGLTDLEVQLQADRVVGATRQDRLAQEVRRTKDVTRPGEGSAALAALLGPKLDLMRSYLTRYAPARARVVILPPVILLLSATMSWAVALVLLVAGPLIPVFMALIGMAARDASRKQMDEIGSMNDLLLERLMALVDIRLLGATDRVTDGFETEVGNLRDRTMAVLRIAFLSSTVLELFAALGVAMVAVYVGFSLLGEIGFGAYGTPLSPVEGIFLLLIAPDYFQPLRDLAAAWHDRAAALAVADELADRHAPTEDSRILGRGAAAHPTDVPLRLVTCGLRQVLPNGRILRFPDLQIGAGETLALTGVSGVGKSTLLALLAGLESPHHGAIEVDGALLDDATADAWRARLGWMPQFPVFPDSPLRDFLTGGAAEPDRTRLDDALRLSDATGILKRLPDGLDTRPGETGGGLSGGEARRLGLARAFYTRPALVLADEPTADLDRTTASLITESLMLLAQSGTAILCATHDPELAARLDREIQLGDAP
ncbi:MAG: ATP-binding cassette domain-containing protein [Rhodobacteraceae bacterium]|nr:ATP-binding cassette domain-containing protein [Paracoccaceae bacterium]MCB1344250.1 ATP-binding cassette domain-containing protein [Paracoccaceae bacterium]